MTYVDLFNAFEIGLWSVLAVVLLVLGARRPAPRWRYGAGAAVLLAFAGSDAVELWTGAWWRPWWLLVWKGACVSGLAALLLFRRSRPDEGVDIS